MVISSPRGVTTELFKDAGALHKDLVSEGSVLKSSEEGVIRDPEQVAHHISIPTHLFLYDFGLLFQKDVKKITTKLLLSWVPREEGMELPPENMRERERERKRISHFERSSWVG